MKRKTVMNGQHVLIHDLATIALSILIALILVRSDVITTILAGTSGWGFVGSFIAGFFFTSVFTTAPAIVALGEIALIHPILPVAFFGALGALMGDLIIFRFVRDKLSEHVVDLMKQTSIMKRYKKLFKLRMFRWSAFLVGGLIIASPLPDELGVSLMGLSKVKTKYFMPLSFCFNFVGIYLIGAVAKTLAG